MNRSKKSKNSNRSRQNTGKNHPELPLLRQIRESLLQDQTSSEPLVPDINISRPSRHRVFTFEFSQTSSIASSTIAEVDGAISLALNNLPGYTSLTTLFDAYRIVAIRCQFIPTSNTYSAGATAPIFTALDYDDNATTVISSLQQYDTLKISPATSYFERSFTPRAAKAVYAGAFTSFGQLTRWDWIDSGSPGVVYYGLKYGVPLNAAGVSWTVLTTYVVECKSQR